MGGMSNSLRLIPPRPEFAVLNAAGNNVDIPAFPFTVLEVTADTWWFARFTPTNVNSSLDLKNNTSLNAGAPVIDGETFETVAGGKWLIVGAGPIDSPAAGLLENILIVKINSVELGRLYINAAGQVCGFVCSVIPGDSEDLRMAMDGTNDLTFTLSQVDPNLRIWAAVGANT